MLIFTCSSSCIVAANGKPSATLAIIVIITIFGRVYFHFSTDTITKLSHQFWICCLSFRFVHLKRGYVHVMTGTSKVTTEQLQVSGLLAFQTASDICRKVLLLYLQFVFCFWISCLLFCFCVWWRRSLWKTKLL